MCSLISPRGRRTPVRGHVNMAESCDDGVGAGDDIGDFDEDFNAALGCVDAIGGGACFATTRGFLVGGARRARAASAAAISATRV